MPRLDLMRECAVVRSPRVKQVEGMFNIAPARRSRETWAVNLPLEERDWNIGLIVGPSGSGKSTIAREMFDAAVFSGFDWPQGKSLLDGFPKAASIKDITEILSSVGFSSPPLWLRPFRVLSTGQQMRVNVARLLIENLDLSVMDEFTSVVDRTVAQIGSAAIAKTVRWRKQKFIAVTCHYDVADWLQPDWVYQSHTAEFLWRFPGRRPEIDLEINRVHRAAWELFKSYHYLDAALNKSARCFCAFWRDVPVAFSAVLHFSHPSGRNIKREHRTVCLPDYQGVGIGQALSAHVGAMCRGMKCRFLSQTSHPIMIRSRAKSADWRMIAKPNMTTPTMGSDLTKHETKGHALRLRATFEYVGQAMSPDLAELLWSGGGPVGDPAGA